MKINLRVFVFSLEKLENELHRAEIHKIIIMNGIVLVGILINKQNGKVLLANTVTPFYLQIIF